MVLNKDQIEAAIRLRMNNLVSVEDLATLLKCSKSTVYKHTYQSPSELLAAGHKLGVMVNGKLVGIM